MFKEAEQYLTTLMTASPEMTKIKLGQYLQEAEKFRSQNQIQKALILTLVAGEFYWRKHLPTRAAGLLLEASDLFYLLEKLEASQRCLSIALDLIVTQSNLRWWEKELFGSIFLFTASLAVLESPLAINLRLTELRQTLSKKQQSHVRREDGYRVALIFLQAAKKGSFTPIEELDTKTTVRSNSEYTTLYEYLMGQAQRYTLINDGLAALMSAISQEAPQ